MPHDIFFSYSHQDALLMSRVSTDLQAAGLLIWSDVHLTPGTESWRKEIEKAIDDTTYIVVIFSPDAKASKWVTAELDYATTQQKPIFPILARGEEHDAVPFGFVTSQWIDVRDDAHYPIELPKLIDAIRNHNLQPVVSTAGHARSVAAHAPAPSQAERLVPWNFLHQVRLLNWLFLAPQEYVFQRSVDREGVIPKTGGWIVSTLCWFPLMLPILGFTLGTVQVSGASEGSRFLLAVYVVYFVGWWVSAIFAGQPRFTSSILGFFVTTLLVFMSFFLVGGVGNVMLMSINDTANLWQLLPMCISFGFAAGLAFIVNTSGTGVVAGSVVGAFIFLTVFKIPLGVAAGISGVVMGGVALMLAVIVDQALKTRRASWLNRGLLVLLAIDYAVMFWIYLLGGWFVITA